MLQCMSCCEIASSLIVGIVCYSMQQSCTMCSTSSNHVAVCVCSARIWWLCQSVVLWELGVRLVWLQQAWTVFFSSGKTEFFPSIEPCVCMMCGVHVLFTVCTVLVIVSDLCVFTYDHLYHILNDDVQCACVVYCVHFIGYCVCLLVVYYVLSLPHVE